MAATVAAVGMGAARALPLIHKGNPVGYDFGTDDFTIKCRLYPYQVDAVRWIMSQPNKITIIKGRRA